MREGKGAKLIWIHKRFSLVLSRYHKCLHLFLDTRNFSFRSGAKNRFFPVKRKNFLRIKVLRDSSLYHRFLIKYFSSIYGLNLHVFFVTHMAVNLKHNFFPSRRKKDREGKRDTKNLRLGFGGMNLEFFFFFRFMKSVDENNSQSLSGDRDGFVSDINKSTFLFIRFKKVYQWTFTKIPFHGLEIFTIFHSSLRNITSNTFFIERFNVQWIVDKWQAAEKERNLLN